MKEYVHAGKVDCQANPSICQQASITGYPSVRIYKGTTTKGYSQVSMASHDKCIVDFTSCQMQFTSIGGFLIVPVKEKMK